METTNRTSKREQILWIAVAILGLIILALLFMYLRTPKGAAPLPSGTLEEFGLTTTPSPSATSTISPMPTLEELPYENTPSDLGMNPNEFATETPPAEEGGGLGSTPEGTATWFVRPFTTRTNTPVPRSYGGGSGGGGYVYKSPTPSNYGATSTAFWKRQTRTATFLVPTRRTATYAAGQTATVSKILTSIASTPRPQQVSYDNGSNMFSVPAPGPQGSPTPTPNLINLGTGQFGDWESGGLSFAYAEGGQIFSQPVNVNGTRKGDAVAIVTMKGSNDQPAYSPNNFWVVFRHQGGSQPEGLYRVNRNGKNQQQLTDNPDDAQPEWSMDSSKVVFANNGIIYFITVNPAQIPVVPTPGNNTPEPTPSQVPTPIKGRTQLTRTQGITYSWPHYSPDMRFLIMQGVQNGRSDIYLLDLTQPFLGDPINMTANQSGNCTEPAWTRDSSRFIFVREPGENGGQDVYVMDRYGNIAPITTDGGAKANPRWRP